MLLPRIAKQLPKQALARMGQIWGLLPVPCLVCSRSGRYQDNLCPDCSAALPRADQVCPGCGMPRPLSTPVCSACLTAARAFDFCRGLFRYQPPVSTLITGFKFHGRLEMGQSLSRLLAAAMDDYYRPDQRPDLLMPVPLHPRRLRERGFNQAREIARVVSRHCHIPLADAAVARRRATAPQSRLGSAGARQRNLAGAFRLIDDAPLANVKHITIIDDVITSMATVEALSRCLRAQQIRRIDVWGLARAGA